MKIKFQWPWKEIDEAVKYEKFIKLKNKSDTLVVPYFIATLANEKVEKQSQKKLWKNELAKVSPSKFYNKKTRYTNFLVSYSHHYLS